MIDKELLNVAANLTDTLLRTNTESIIADTGHIPATLKPSDVVRTTLKIYDQLKMEFK
ncbi:hypothetical protein ABTQ33_13210 (plasmid) [Paucilactobacillus suebicus]|uniref:hypothetical protein n=1 Tax=Paucilactobacillus suebicus TaxID=152335 RepID=UPI00031328AA|nr:hypothetical protein [Paucilactobacillus suebicus]